MAVVRRLMTVLVFVGSKVWCCRLSVKVLGIYFVYQLP